jgi:hypothetical protein
LPFFVTVRRSCATWAAPSNSIQAGARMTLTVRRARRPWSFVTVETEGTLGQGSFLSCREQGGHVALDGLRVVRVPAEDELLGVVLRVQRVQDDDRPGQVGECGQQVPDRGDLVAFRVHGDLAKDRADAVRESRDQVRGLPVLALRAPTALPSTAITSRPAARTALVNSQAPRTWSRMFALSWANARR